MPLGNVLQQRENRYSCLYDDKTHTWRLLDTWHDSMKNLTTDDNIPDDHPALTILSEAAFIELVKTATRLEVLQNAVVATSAEEVEELKTEIKRLSTANLELKQMLASKPAEKLLPPMSESFALKNKAMDSILKVIAIEALENGR